RAFIRNDSTQNQILGGQGDVFTDEWALVAFRRGSGVTSIWVNNRETFRVAHSVSGTVTLNRTALGARLRSSAASFLTGLVQHAAVWTTALSDAQLLAIFEASGIDAYRAGPFTLSVLERGEDLGTGNAQGVG